MATRSTIELSAQNKYDLTGVMCKYLDRHLIFPLLEFLAKNEIYSRDSLVKAKLDLISGTNMIDYAVEIFKQEYGEDKSPPETLVSRRDGVVDQLQSLKEASGPVLDLLERVDEVKQLKADGLFNLKYLTDNYDVDEDSVEALYDYAKCCFECGNYSATAEYLYHYRALASEQGRGDLALWGKLAAEILMLDWETALEDLMELKEIIDRKTFLDPLIQLQQRAWLIHWSLFIFFNHPKGRNGVIDLCFEDRYINTIQTVCPHILRYLTTAVITNKRRRQVLKQLVRVIQQESYTYRDPITEFLECLYVRFDFDKAQQKLGECAEVLENDFFLVACHEDFMENARLFIFETYCRVHQVIDISMLSQKLHMETDEAEHWIVNLIRNASLDAKIDSKNNTVVMGTHYPSIYQQVIEHTKGLSFRSYVLANNANQDIRDLQDQRQRRNNRRGDKRRGGDRNDRGDKRRGDRGDRDNRNDRGDRNDRDNRDKKRNYN